MANAYYSTVFTQPADDVCVVARVVRLFDGGFAVRFVEKQDVQRLAARVSLDATGYTLE